MTTQTTIQRIKDCAKITDVMHRYGIELHRAGSGFKALCPFHEDRHPSLMVSPARNICNCFVCADGGMDPIAFVMRMESCGFRTALQRLADMYHIDACLTSDGSRLGSITPPRPVKPLPPEYRVPESLVVRSMQGYAINPLHCFMSRLFGPEATMHVFRLYGVGTYRRAEGSTVFWQRDALGEVRTGKIMAYDRLTGHRLKHVPPQWAHPKGVRLGQCLFGEHLLPFACGAVNIVESEKTALMAHVRFGGLWLATGGKGGTSLLRAAKPMLYNRRVVLWPDADTHSDWQQLGRSLSAEGWHDVRIDCTVATLAPGTKCDIADLIADRRV